MIIDTKKVKKKLKKENSVYLKISPGTILFHKLMEKADNEGADWQELARTILKQKLLNL